MTAFLFKDATAAGVHSPTALGNEGRKKRRAKLFTESSAGGASEDSIGVDKAKQPRSMRMMAGEENLAHSPFPHDAGALANMRHDQVPRFLGALTDPKKLPKKTMRLRSLTAIQNRVDATKVAALQSSKSGNPPVVVRMGGRNYIADGHHRASAAYMNGDDTIDVHYADLTAKDESVKPETAKVFSKAQVVKVDEKLGLVFGFAIICKQNGKDYFDLQNDHIPEDSMLAAGVDFMINSRVAKEMHTGGDEGTVVFAFPLTTEIAKSLDITSKQTGFLIAMKPSAAMLTKFKSGELTGFSIGGHRIKDENYDD